MIIKKEYRDKEKTLYECDMCKKKIKRQENTKIYKQSIEDKNAKKKYDLCNRCYSILERSIEKYRRNK